MLYEAETIFNKYLSLFTYILQYSVCHEDSKLRELSLNHTVSCSGSGRVKCETKLFLLLVRRGSFSWEYPVFTPPKCLAMFEMREMILKGRKPKSWLKSFI